MGFRGDSATWIHETALAARQSLSSVSGREPVTGGERPDRDEGDHARVLEGGDRHAARGRESLSSAADL